MNQHQLSPQRASLRTPDRKIGNWILAAATLTLGGWAQAGGELTESQIQEKLTGTDSPLAAVVSKIERTVTFGDATYLQQLINTDAVLARATAGVDGEEVESVRKIFVDGTKKAWESNSPANDYAGTHFHFLRPRTFHGHGGALFRSENESGSLNYYLLVLGETAPEKYEVRDIFVVGLNEFASDTLRRTYHHLVTSFVGKVDGQLLSNVGAAYIEHLQEIADMSRAMRQGKYAAALELWQQLPKSVQFERSVLMNRIDAADHISAEERLAAMQDWARKYPNEMELPLKMADFYVARNQWDDARRVMTKVLDLVGGDSRLLFQVGQVAYRRKLDGNSVAKTPAATELPLHEESAKAK